MPEEKKKDTHYTKEGMDRRLQEYKDRNDEAQENPPLVSFFEKRGVEVVTLKVEDAESDQQKIILETIEKVGVIFLKQKLKKKSGWKIGIHD